MDRMRTTSVNPLPSDEVAAQLDDLASGLAVRLAGVASVDWASSEDAGFPGGVEVMPAVKDAVRVWWTHSSEEINVGFDDCTGWDLPRSPASVEIVHAIVNAAVAGAVDIGAGRGVKVYRVRMPDGSVREDTYEGLAGVLLAMPWKPRLRWRAATPYS